MKTHRTHAVLLNHKGLHARASARLAEICDLAYPEVIQEVEVGFCCDFRDPYATPTHYADARTIMDCLSIAASRNSIIHIKSKGESPIAANRFILQLIANGFHEFTGTDAAAIFEKIPSRFLGAPEYMRMVDFVLRIIENNSKKDLFLSNQDDF